MPKNCINRKCVLLNFAYNLTLNNIISGLGSFLKVNVQEILGGFLLIGAGVLLLVGTYKENRSLILTFLILEPFLLAYESVKLSVDFINYREGTNENFGILNYLAIVGVIFSWASIYPVYVLYKDLDKNDETGTKEKEGYDGNDLSKNAVV